jgi:hypothetical protein
MWRLLSSTIPETLRAELETRIGAVSAGARPGGRQPEVELDGFFAASISAWCRRTRQPRPANQPAISGGMMGGSLVMMRT